MLRVKVNRIAMILFVKGKLAIVGDFDHSDCDDIGTIAGAGAGGENLITGDWIGG